MYAKYVCVGVSMCKCESRINPMKGTNKEKEREREVEGKKQWLFVFEKTVVKFFACTKPYQLYERNQGALVADTLWYSVL